MIWIALSEKDTDNAALEKRLWDAADHFRANSGLRACLKTQESPIKAEKRLYFFAHLPQYAGDAIYH